MQHAAGDLRPGGAAGGEPQLAGEPAAAAGGGGESARVGEQQRGAGEVRHDPPESGQDRAGAQRGAGTHEDPGPRRRIIDWWHHQFRVQIF